MTQTVRVDSPRGGTEPITRYHVHDAVCRDLSRRRYAGNSHQIHEVGSVSELVDSVFGDLIEERSSQDDSYNWGEEFEIFPCVKLPARPTGPAQSEQLDRAQKDAAALDSIARMLQHPDWGVGMLEDIDEIITSTGRSTATRYGADGEAIGTWGRH